MRIRIDSTQPYGVAQEARLALRHAGFVLAEPSKPADYVVELAEHERGGDVIVAGSDGSLEREVINRLATTCPVMMLDRRGRRNDQAVMITIPPSDDLRQAVSRVLVEIFLTYVNHPAFPTPAQSPRTLAIAVTLDRLVQHLLDTEPTPEQIARRLQRSMASWWEFWSWR